MTKTEAIDLLDNLVGMVEDNQENDYDEALKMAIEALRTIEKQQHDGCLNCDHFDVVRQIQWERDTAIQQLKELGYGLGEKIRTDGDTISRQEAIDALDGEITVTGRANAEAVRGYARLVADRLKSLPSAQRKGKWIYLNGLDAFECSVCGRQMVRNIFDYCPWCGAEMRKERK